MDTRSDLAFFHLLAHQDSLAAAARTLGLSPSAISRRLAALEQRLGVRLLARTTRRISLTGEGERYLEGASAILDHIRQLEQELAGSSAQPQGLLRIAAGFGFGRQHLGPVISAFAAAYPGVSVILHLSDQPLDFAQNAIDIAIRFGPPPDAHLLARKIAANRRLLCAAPDYLARHGTPATPADLSRHACIVIRENAPTFNHWQLTDGQHVRRVRVHGPLAVNHGEIAVDWALAGHGIVLRSEWDIAQHLESGALRQVLPEWYDNAADIHALYPPRHALSAKVRLFLDFLTAHYQARQPG